MRKLLSLLLVCVLLAPTQSWAASGATTVQANDSGGTARTFNVFSSTGLVTGNLSWMNTICDFTTVTNCATVDAQHGVLVGGEGTAGTPAGGVVSVQGVGSGTALPVSAASLPLPTGAAISAAQNVNGQTTAHTCSTGGYSELGCLGQIDDDIKGALPAGTNVIGYNSNDPCSQAVKSNFALASSSGNVQVVGGVSAKKVYVCSISIIAAATAVINVIEGTGAACTTANEAAVIGSTTAASGMSLPANGGFTLGNGAGTIAVTATSANGICILQSGTTALAGNVTYVQQ